VTYALVVATLTTHAFIILGANSSARLARAAAPRRR
jgi:hypothetical protein